MAQRLCILGASGSIGVSTLDVVARHPDRFDVYAISGHRQVERLLEQCRRFSPRYLVVTDPQCAVEAEKSLRASGSSTELLVGHDALAQVASCDEVDTVMAAIVGAAGLRPTLAAVRAGKKVLLANKESLVMAGDLFMHEVATCGATLLPIDSEHNAVFQSLPGPCRGELAEQGVRRILLTASGGPFRSMAPEQLHDVTPEQACAHPNWVMGRKISVDSATMMNKGLEVIEAHFLFGAPADAISVVIHAQSVIHSMVEYIDGSVLAQLGNPDMRTPIAHALAYPARMESGVASLDIAAIGRLEFEAPDLRRFPCLGLAYDALRVGGTASAVLNAANEIAVEAFLAGKLRFTAIDSLAAAVLDATSTQAASDIETVLEADARARECARELLGRRAFAVV